MTLKIFTLCDNAFFDKQNKLHIIGSFDTVMAESLPTQLTKMALAISVVEVQKNVHITFQFEILDPLGSTAAPAQNIELTNAENETVNVIVNIPVMELHKAGVYTFRLKSGEKVLGHFPLVVHSTSQGLQS